MTEAQAEYEEALASWNNFAEHWQRRLAGLREAAAATCEHPAGFVTSYTTGDEGYASDFIHGHEYCKVCRKSRETYPRQTEWTAK